ncbi:MAG: DNA mismatch endonuclease Vsr [Deltaproteobacteria bacterium]
MSNARSRRRGPRPSSPEAKRRMERTRRRDTRPELELRRCLYALGVRGYRIDAKVIDGLRRRADIVFRRLRLAIYVDGCFWHGCPEHATWPKANAAFWRDKIETNRCRDRDTNEKLAGAAWYVIRIWAHVDPVSAAETVSTLVFDRRKTPRSNLDSGLLVIS